LLLTIFRIAMSLISGYLFIKWCPVIELVSMSDIIVQLVLSPVKFFASSISLMAGILLNAELFKEEAAMVMNIVHRPFPSEALVFPIHIAGLYFLSTLGLWQTMLFLCLALIYGMISVDFSGKTRRTS
jgi:hypothetical protein